MSQSQSRSQAIYTFIQRYLAEQGYPPSARDIAEGCALSKSSVIYHLDRLEGEGCISREPHLARSIRLVDKPKALDSETQRVWDYLQRELKAGMCPSQQEIAKACYLSRWVVQKALTKLEARGRIARGAGRRSIRLQRC